MFCKCWWFVNAFIDETDVSKTCFGRFGCFLHTFRNTTGLLEMCFASVGVSEIRLLQTPVLQQHVLEGLGVGTHVSCQNRFVGNVFCRCIGHFFMHFAPVSQCSESFIAINRHTEAKKVFRWDRMSHGAIISAQKPFVKTLTTAHQQDMFREFRR